MSKKAIIIIKSDEDRELSYIKNIVQNYISDLKIISISDEKETKKVYPNSYILKADSYYNENIIAFIKKTIESFKPEFIFSTSSYEIKNILAQIAVETKSGILTDCYNIEINGMETYAEKYAYGGNIIARLSANSHLKIITLNGSSLDVKNEETAQTEEIDIIKSSKIKIISKEIKKKEITPDNADKVIGIGRGVRIEDMPLIKKFASSIKAAVGYTRPLVYEGVGEQEYQIGITGKIISPKLYIAIGISGKEYHIKGIEKSKKIISVNTDPNAPIKKVSDYFICSDYRTFLKKIYTE